MKGVRWNSNPLANLIAPDSQSGTAQPTPSRTQWSWRDSNSQIIVSKTIAYTSSATRP
jgi:hypothetical protein